VTGADVNHENRHIPLTDSHLATSTRFVTAASPTAPRAPAFSGFPPPYPPPRLRSWFVTSGRGHAWSRPPCLRVLERDARPVALARRRVLAPDPASFEPAPIGCDGLVDIRRGRTAVAAHGAVESSNDTRCTVPSAASHRFARRCLRHLLDTATTATPGSIAAAATIRGQLASSDPLTAATWLRS
jgi:hypothetical protein